MLIFNTTFHTDEDVHDDYLDFMKHIYIPQALDGGLLSTPRFARIHRQHEQDGVSYSLQFCVKNMETLNFWLEQKGVLLQQHISQKFNTKVAGFITVMEEVELA